MGDLARPVRPECEVRRVDERQSRPEAVDLRDVSCERDGRSVRHPRKAVEREKRATRRVWDSRGQQRLALDPCEGPTTRPHPAGERERTCDLAQQPNNNRDARAEQDRRVQGVRLWIEVPGKMVSSALHRIQRGRTKTHHVRRSAGRNEEGASAANERIAGKSECVAWCGVSLSILSGGTSGMRVRGSKARATLDGEGIGIDCELQRMQCWWRV